MAKAKQETIDPVNEKLVNKIKEEGISLTSVIFHDTVTSRTSDHLPEFAMYADHPKKSRKAKLWYHPIGLLIHQDEGYKIVPLANVKDTNLA